MLRLGALKNEGITITEVPARPSTVKLLKCGLYKQLVFIYMWYLGQVWLYLPWTKCDVKHCEMEGGQLEIFMLEIYENRVRFADGQVAE